MRIASSLSLAGAFALIFAAGAMADLTDPTSDSSIPLRGSEAGTVVQPADIQPFTNTGSSTNSIARPEDFQLQPKSNSLTNTTTGGDTIKPFSGRQAEKEPKPIKQHSDSLTGDALGVPDRAAKSSLGLTDRAAKSSVGLSDRAAKGSVGLADRAAKTGIGVPGKILKSLF